MTHGRDEFVLHLFVTLAFRDVARDPDKSDDLTAMIADRRLGGGKPPDRAVRLELIFDVVNQRLAGGEDCFILLPPEASVLRR